MKYNILIILVLLVFNAPAQTVVLRLSNPIVNGNRVSYDVSVDGFTNLAIMKYNITYDSDQLSFFQIQNVIVPGMNPIFSFTTNVPGIIRSDWLDPTLEGVTFPDGTVIYKVVFTMLNGTFGNLCFSEVHDTYRITTAEGVYIDSIYVLDDCHDEPYLIEDITATPYFLPGNQGVTIHHVLGSKEIVFSLDLNMSIRFALVDLYGRIVYSSDKEEYDKGSHSIHLNGSLATGLYILFGESSGGWFSEKIIVSH